jgi:hypothetical protein
LMPIILLSEVVLAQGGYFWFDFFRCFWFGFVHLLFFLFFLFLRPFRRPLGA